MYAAHRCDICVPATAIELREQRVLREARVVADVIQNYANLGFLLAPVLAAQLNHLELQVDDFAESRHGVGVQLVEEEGFSIMVRVRAVDKLRLDEPRHRVPGLVDTVFKRGAYGRREHVDAIKAGLAVAANPHLSDEAL